KRANLRIPESQFFKELLRGQSQVVGRYDARITGEDATDIGVGPEFDPSDAAVTPPFTQMINAYLEDELKIDEPELEGRYRITNYGSGWDYGLGGEGGYPQTTDLLRQAF